MSLIWRQDPNEQCRQSIKRRTITMIRQCFFWKKDADEGDLHQVSTYHMDASRRTMINELQDTELLARIVGGDLIAMDAKYHLKWVDCTLTWLYGTLLEICYRAPGGQQPLLKLRYINW